MLRVAPVIASGPAGPLGRAAQAPEIERVSRRGAGVSLTADPYAPSHRGQSTCRGAHRSRRAHLRSDHRVRRPARRQIDRRRPGRCRFGSSTASVTAPARRPRATARAVVLIRANNLARGHSAVRAALVERLLDLLNVGITPIIPEEGSVGASGDLIPLSYVAATLTGARTVRYRERVCGALEALRQASGGARPRRGSHSSTAPLHDRLRRAGRRRRPPSRAPLRRLHGPVRRSARRYRGAVRSLPPRRRQAAPWTDALAANVRARLEGSTLARPTQNWAARHERSGLPRARGERSGQVLIRCAPQFTGVLWDTSNGRALARDRDLEQRQPAFDSESGGCTAAATSPAATSR